MPRETAREKGSRLLVEGRLILTHVDAATVEATCRGEGTTYRLGYRAGAFHCQCLAGSTAKFLACSHVMALKRVVSIDLEEPR